jgi:hypothetical protein
MIKDYYDFHMGSDFLSSRSISDADRDRDRKLARLRRGFRPSRIAATNGANALDNPPPRIPTTGIAFCCARSGGGAITAQASRRAVRAGLFDRLVGAGEDNWWDR